ncbi:SANT domain-containing protein [Caenorhabditis elegans]|uniref:SANT domain-containing protein n=2 Tax=Caenorhabditis elegans TaxID=6239 RepID=Q19953_CAEEL|nr:SANT domain-containing protein [Caenorhabditis elegans]CCD66269.1 SANT domain-containing protein [Caenorhabditis elegans]|eukprot:NP_001022133.1 ADA (histone acetyltransferase complex) subunit [Caenorhabditis elegans]
MGNVMLSKRKSGSMADDTGEHPVCFNCTLRVDQTIHVKCFECPLRICILCFQCGAESPPHRRGHNYELVKPTSNPEAMSWTHEDEFELLKAAHKFKMGNWGEIAESIGRGRKDGHNCKDYFEKHFVRGWIGQFSIKSSSWDRIKYGMYINQTLDSVLQKNCLESTERMLLIRDAVRASGESWDENDPKLAIKVQQVLEQYVQKVIDGDIETKYERPKFLTNQYETELSPDDCDPDNERDMKSKRSVKQEINTDDSDNDNSPGPSSSCRKKGPPSPKRRKTTRVMRESSSDSDDDKSQASDKDTYHGMERETEEEDPPSAFETAQEFDTEDEEEEKKPKRGTASSSKRRKRRRMWVSKKDRRLHEFRKKMNQEVKELRSAYPRLLHESGVSKSETRPKMRRSDELKILGYNNEREELECEWFNEAEQLISRLTISATEPQKDQRLDMENDIKFARLRHYVRLLGIRKAKRNTVLEHDKINEFMKFYQEACYAAAKRPVSQQEIMDSRTEKEKLLAMTQQFLTRDEYRSLRASIERIDNVVERIEVLQDLQKNGETTLKNAPVERKSKKKMRKIDCEQKKKIATEWSKFKKWHTEGWE